MDAMLEIDEAGSVAGMRAAIDALVASGARCVQVLASVDNPWNVAEVDAALASLPVPAFGGLFPGLIHDGRSLAIGTLVIGHRQAPTIEVIAASDYERPETIERLARLRPAETLAIYIDATTPVGALVGSVFEALGGGAAAYGGGAGALDFVPRPVVVTPGGLVQGGAVVAAFGEATAVGVAHGWTPFSETLVVTESHGSAVLSLDWRPALVRYREVVEAHAGVALDAAGFQSLAARYPLMVEAEGGEGVVRDPLQATADGHVLCAGDVPRNSTVRVATGDPDSMRAAAATARAIAVERAAGAPASVALTIDCISRALLLGPALAAELQALRVPGLPQVGALTIGEIASNGDGYLLVHNKTSVVALLGRSDV
jgi:hypothetical protein